MKPRKASMAPPPSARSRRMSILTTPARATELLEARRASHAAPTNNAMHDALLDAEDVAIDALDELLSGLIRSMEENTLRKATLVHTAAVATSCVMGMLGMMMLPHTRTPPVVDESSRRVPPTPAPIDIWSKAVVPSKRKPLARSSTSKSFVNGLSPTRESVRSASPKKSPPKVLLPPSVPETSTDASVQLAVQFSSSYVDMVPITLEELARRDGIERILAADADRIKRIEIEEARTRATATLVMDPDEIEKARQASDVPIESEVVLCEEKELLVGENSLLVSRRSKKDLLRRLPPPRFEPQIVVPETTRLQSPATSSGLRTQSRSSSRHHIPKTALKPKTPQAHRLVPLNFSSPADAAKLFVRFEALNGGPVFDEQSSPVSRGVVIKHKGFEKRGADWRGASAELYARTESEPSLRPSRSQSKKRPSKTADIPEPNVLQLNAPTSFSQASLPQPVHHHDEVKSLTMRIRTPACKSRRSRRVVDLDVDDRDAMIFEPQTVVLRPSAVKLPHIHDRDAAPDTVSIQNKALTLPLLATLTSPSPSR
ncbi:hypothetical protein ACHHYP_00607 [Achlya hypogyna]|uniref:Uncharacterized protein n=1 Tax=Achlya hypogyna TaxID=1202772 RepID=A0A1V9ZUA4_ACHHY|nr:hypothetical protein ACHHYP_00607 [Achlya hypogyna]